MDGLFVTRIANVTHFGDVFEEDPVITCLKTAVKLCCGPDKKLFKNTLGAV